MSWMNNKFHAQRSPYVITAADEANGFALVPVVWDIPYPDNDYTVVVSVNDVSGNPPAISTVIVDIHNKTATGFVMNLLCFAGTTGEAILLHSFALHD
jgi:hypothetical protein